MQHQMPWPLSDVAAHSRHACPEKLQLQGAPLQALQFDRSKFGSLEGVLCTFWKVVVLVAEQVMHASKVWVAYQVEFYISASSHLLPLLLFLSEVIIFVLGNNGQIRVNLKSNRTHQGY